MILCLQEDYVPSEIVAVLKTRGILAVTAHPQKTTIQLVLKALRLEKSIVISVEPDEGNIYRCLIFTNRVIRPEKQIEVSIRYSTARSAYKNCYYMKKGSYQYDRAIIMAIEFVINNLL